MKIGIIFPNSVDLGLVRRARQLSLLLGGIRDADGEPWSTAIGVPRRSEQQWRSLEIELRDGNPNATVRQLQWEPVPVENAERMFPKALDAFDLEGIEDVMEPRDWGWNFRDCDAAVCFADPGLGAALPLVPTLYYCPDLAVRIAPDNFASSIDDDFWPRQTSSFRMWRQAHVATSDPATADDLVSYAGVRGARVHLLPNLLDAPPNVAGSGPERDPSLLAWLFGTGPLNDLENAAKALSIYLAEGGRLLPMLVHDGLRDPDAGDLGGIGSLRTDLADLLYGLPGHTVSSDRELFRLLGRSGAVWSSRIAGGEGEAPLLAKHSGAQFLGADHASNRSAVNGQAIPSELYALGDPLAIVDSLHALEEKIAASPASVRTPGEGDGGKRAEAFAALLRRLVDGSLGG